MAQRIIHQLVDDLDGTELVTGEGDGSDWWDRATPEQVGHTYQVAPA